MVTSSLPAPIIFQPSSGLLESTDKSSESLPIDEITAPPIDLNSYCQSLIKDRIGRIRCNICGIYLPSIHGAVNGCICHALSHFYPVIFFCRFCDFTSSRKNGMKTHLQIRHKLPNSDDFPNDWAGTRKQEMVEVIDRCYGTGDEKEKQ